MLNCLVISETQSPSLAAHYDYLFQDSFVFFLLAHCVKQRAFEDELCSSLQKMLFKIFFSGTLNTFIILEKFRSSICCPMCFTA